MADDINEQHSVLTSKIDDYENNSIKEQFKLPKIPNPPSRARIPSRKQNKTPTYFPNINTSEEIDHFRRTQLIKIGLNQTLRSSQPDLLKDDLTIDIQQKLRNLTHHEEIKTQRNAEESPQQFNQNDQDDSDFLQKINQNKQIIKMHRQKNQLHQKKIQIDKPNEHLEKISHKAKQKIVKPTTYQKKLNNYSESLENKFLLRKKQALGIIPQKSSKPIPRAKSKKIISTKDSNDVAKINFGYKQFKSNGQIHKVNGSIDNVGRGQQVIRSAKVNKVSISNANSSKNIIPKQLHKTQQNSPPKRTNRTSTLFDGIQNFLENPTDVSKHQKFYKQLTKKLLNKNQDKLQQEIRQLNEKLGINQNNNETKSTVQKSESDNPFVLTQNPHQRTVRDWKRVSIKDKHNFYCKQSNFQKELDYVNYLQEKSSTSLSKFIDHQKMMLQLQMNRRFSKSIGKQIHSQAIN